MVEISGVHVKLTGDSSNLNSALDDAQGELKDTQKDAKDTSKSLRGMGKAFLGAAAAAAGIVGVGSLFKSIASEGEKFETSMLKINAIIKATGGAAGKTGEELRESARALALNTLESTEGVLAAQQRLLTFRKITGDVFDRAIALSADLSGAMGQDLSGAAVQLGRALEDPVRGLQALRRTGASFEEQEQELIKSLVESGRLLEAQEFILKKLEGHLGGTDTLGQRQQEFLLAINDTLGVTDALAAAVNGIANVFKLLTENIKRVISYIAATAIAAMFAFRGAIVAGALSITKLMIPSLAGLRVALIRTGIGLLIVGLGELIFQITRVVGFFQDLIKATGGIGAAMSLLGDVMVEEFERAIVSLKIFGLEVKKFGLEVELKMAQAFADKMPEAVKAGARVMLRTFAGLRAAAGELFNAVFDAISLQNFEAPDLLGAFAGGLAEQIEGMFAEGDPVISIQNSIRSLNRQIATLGRTIDGPNEALERMRALLAAISNETPVGPVVAGIGGAGTGGAGASDPLADRLKALRDTLFQETATEMELLEAKHKMREELLAEQRAQEILGFREHLLAVLREEEVFQEARNKILQQGEDLRLAAVSQTFGAMASLMQAGGKKMIGIAKVFGATEALINAYRAFNATLADRELPWYMRIPKAVAVLGAGLNMVKAIKGAGSGGGGAGGSAASASGSAEPAPVSRNVAISLAGGDMFGRDQVIGLINQINEAVEDGAVVRLA
jgi:hypothetical protein